MTRLEARPYVLAMICVVGGLGLGGCRSATDGPPAPSSPSGTGAVRAVNGIADSTSINAAVSGTGVSANQIALDGASPLLSLPAGRYAVQVQPDHGNAFSVNGVGVTASTLSTVVANGVLGNGTQNGFVASESLSAPATGQVAVQPVFGAYTYAHTYSQDTQAYAYTFTFTPLGTTTASQASSSESTLYGQSPAALTLASNQYRIEVTGAANCPPTQSCPASVFLVFDSGTAHGVMLPATNSTGANVVQIVAVDATSAQKSQYGSSVVLLLLDSSGGVTPLYNSQ